MRAVGKALLWVVGTIGYFGIVLAFMYAALLITKAVATA